MVLVYPPMPHQWQQTTLTAHCTVNCTVSAQSLHKHCRVSIQTLYHRARVYTYVDKHVYTHLHTHFKTQATNFADCRENEQSPIDIDTTAALAHTVKAVPLLVSFQPTGSVSRPFGSQEPPAPDFCRSKTLPCFAIIEMAADPCVTVTRVPSICEQMPLLPSITEARFFAMTKMFACSN